MTIILRYVDKNGRIQEQFFDLVNIKGISRAWYFVMIHMSIGKDTMVSSKNREIFSNLI
jgi:hypothetical protein